MQDNTKNTDTNSAVTIYGEDGFVRPLNLETYIASEKKRLENREPVRVPGIEFRWFVATILELMWLLRYEEETLSCRGATVGGEFEEGENLLRMSPAEASADSGTEARRARGENDRRIEKIKALLQEGQRRLEEKRGKGRLKKARALIAAAKAAAEEEFQRELQQEEAELGLYSLKGFEPLPRDEEEEQDRVWVGLWEEPVKDFGPCPVAGAEALATRLAAIEAAVGSARGNPARTSVVVGRLYKTANLAREEFFSFGKKSSSDPTLRREHWRVLNNAARAALLDLKPGLSPGKVPAQLLSWEEKCSLEGVKPSDELAHVASLTVSSSSEDETGEEAYASPDPNPEEVLLLWEGQEEE